MRKTNFTHREIADFCREMALMLHSGIGVAEALSLLEEEENDANWRELLVELAQLTGDGIALSEAVRQTGRFPTYMTGLIDVGEVIRFSLIGAFAIGIPLLLIVLIADKVLGQDSMGGGDIKLFFVAGLYFGWRQCLFLIIAACIIGIAMALTSAATGKEGDSSLRKRQIPFGPAIAAACVLIAAFGGEVVSAYDALFL